MANHHHHQSYHHYHHKDHYPYYNPLSLPSSDPRSPLYHPQFLSQQTVKKQSKASVPKSPLSLLLLTLHLLISTCNCATYNTANNSPGGQRTFTPANLNSNNNHLRVHKHFSTHIERTLGELDRLQVLDYGEPCDSLNEEKERHDLNDLVAQIIRSPNEELLGQINSRKEEIVLGGKRMCNYTRGLACDQVSQSCTCYTGSRHGDIFYEPIRENGSCKLDEMSRCYSPSYLVSRGASVIPCVSGSKCVGEITGRRCVSPLMTENCHCVRPCPDGTFPNVSEELRKCISKLEEISVLSFGDNCSFTDQVDRDEVIGSLERGERAGPIIRGIKRLLVADRLLCSPEEQLICDEGTQTCTCGPEKDGLLYDRGHNGTCQWAKGSRCFPQDLYSNVTGSNGSCVQGTECLLEGELIPCDPAIEEPLCFCQDPDELDSGGVITSVIILLIVVIGGGGFLAFLVHAKKINCPPGSSPANV